jgi:hypothetical protein
MLYVLYFGTAAKYLCIVNLNDTIMNADNTLSFISTMITSESSYKALVDMINEMDLELMSVNLA